MTRFNREIKRVVVKVGTSSITHDNGDVNLSKIDNIAWELSNLKNHGIEVVLVSSAAIAAGAKRLNLPKRPRDVAGKQATSAVGQVTLMNTYNRAFSEYNYVAAQILLTKQIETDDIMKENSQNVFKHLLKMNVIPVVNENDTISTFEIEYGDNDTLSAVVSRLIDADLLILLSDIDGLYSCDPRQNNDACFIHEVNKIDDELWSMASDTNSNVGTGGMTTKIRAAELCLDKGIDVVIANSKNMNVIRKIVRGEEIGTLFRKGEKDD